MVRPARSGLFVGRSAATLALVAGLLGGGALAVLAPPAFAHPAPAGDDDDDDDDILAPVRTGGQRPATAVPEKARDLKVGVVGIVPVGEASKPLADQLTAELTKAFNESASVAFSALSVSSGGSGSGPAIDLAAADKSKAAGDAALARGKDFLQKLQFGKAQKAFEAAIAAYEKAAPVLLGPDVLVEAWVGLAEVAARQAKEADAERRLSFAASYNPELQLDPKTYPNLFIRTFEKVRDRAAKSEQVAILVDESASGAAVEIDGRPIANAPVRARGLLAGAHLVRVLRQGQAPFGTIVVVERGGEGTVSPGFLDKSKVSPSDDLANNRFSAASAATVAEAARAAGLKGAVVGAVAKDGNKVIAQLVYVDATSSQVALLPLARFQGDLLDISIESLKARGAAEDLAAGSGSLARADSATPLIKDARVGAAAQLSEVQVRYDLKSVPAGRTSRVEAAAASGGEDDDDEGGRRIVSAKRGSRQRLDDDQDAYRTRKSRAEVQEEEESLTAQPWFMPVVISTGVAVGLAAIAGGGVALVGLKVLPDPRPVSGGQINVQLPGGTPAAAP